MKIKIKNKSLVYGIFIAILYTISSYFFGNYCEHWDGVDVSGNPIGGALFCNYLGITLETMSGLISISFIISIIIVFLISAIIINKISQRNRKF